LYRLSATAVQAEKSMHENIAASGLTAEPSRFSFSHEQQKTAQNEGETLMKKVSACPSRETFIRLYCEQQMSAVYIGCKYGVSERTVYLWARLLGVKVDRKGRPKKIYISERQTYARRAWTKSA
jgi:sialic acid synthase SpsE